MTRVIKIDGAPGTGKTYTLKQKLQSAKQRGITVSDFWWLTFTNAGRNDVEHELGDVFPRAEKDPAGRASTFHGLTLSLIVRNGVIDPSEVHEVLISPTDSNTQEYYKDFCATHGLPFDERYSDPRKLLAGEKATEHTGNLLFAVNDYLTQTCKSPEQWRSATVDIPIPGERVITLLEAWDSYKREARESRLFEHGDYVAEAFGRALVPSVDVLLVDEFQDLAPLEYRLYKLWRDSGEIGRIYIAGDPNQSIYSFRGGTPYYFEHTDYDDYLDLKTSYRCPEQIAHIGNAVLATHTDTTPRGFTGKESGGRTQWHTLRDKHALRTGVIRATERYSDSNPSVFLLTRTRRQRYQLMKDLKDVGVPFEVLGKLNSIWDGDLQQILTFLNNLTNGVTAFAWPNVRTVFEHLPDGQERKQNADSGIGPIREADAITPVLDDYEGPLAIVEHLELESWKRDILTNAVDAPGAIEASEIQVGTIHTAKGLESPCVYLFGETTTNTVKRYSRNPEFAAEEHRVYYVGTTRASAELYLVDGYFDGPTAPPLEKVRQTETVTP